VYDAIYVSQAQKLALMTSFKESCGVLDFSSEHFQDILKENEDQE
jgi:hypothetical protein